MSLMDEVATAELVKDLNDEIQGLRVELARERVQRRMAEKARDSYKVEIFRQQADRTYTVG